MRKLVAILPLHDKEHDRPRPALGRGGELPQVLGASLRDRIGKLGRPARRARVALQMDVLDLDVANRSSRALEQQVDARAFAVAHLAPDGGIAGKLGEPLGQERLLDETVGMGRVDTDESARGEDQLKVKGSLRAGFGERDSQTSEPGLSRPIMPPGFGQCTVATVPSASSTSARKRL